MKKQICFIHGGTTYDSYAEYIDALRTKELSYERLLYAAGWREWMIERLNGWDIIVPSMPSKQNAQYDEWAMYFSKIMPFLSQSAVLVGHSLGGVFLAKYLQESPPVTRFQKLILLAPPYNDESTESLGEFKLDTAKGLDQVANELHIMHSTDDPVVSYDESQKYLQDVPSANMHRFTDRHHFIGETFPELLDIVVSS